MIWLTENKNNLRLNEACTSFRKVDADVGYVVFAYFMKQYHLDCANYFMDKEDSKTFWIDEQEVYEQFDSLIKDQLDFSNILAPIRLFTHYLICTFLNVEIALGDLRINHGKKLRFVYDLKTVEFDQLTSSQNEFKQSDWGRFLLNRLPKKELKSAQANFFALLDDKFEVKLFNAMVQFQSETGITVDKTTMIEYILNVERKQKIDAFLRLEIDKL